MSEQPPFPASLCHRCRYLRIIRSARGSSFLMCQEPSLPKYTAQPVQSCRGFAPIMPPGPPGPLESPG